MAASTGEEMLKKNVWAVVGNHGRNPVVEKLCDRLRSHGKTVFRVNRTESPRGVQVLDRDRRRGRCA